jgi:hypothetical protein
VSGKPVKPNHEPSKAPPTKSVVNTIDILDEGAILKSDEVQSLFDESLARTDANAKRRSR